MSDINIPSTQVTVRVADNTRIRAGELVQITTGGTVEPANNSLAPIFGMALEPANNNGVVMVQMSTPDYIIGTNLIPSLHCPKCLRHSSCFADITYQGADMCLCYCGTRLFEEDCVEVKDK